MRSPRPDLRRPLLGVAVAVALLAPVGWFWWTSRVPDQLPVMAMGTPDYGGGPAMSHGAGGVSITALTGPVIGRPDVAVDLTARQQRFRLASGEAVRGYTLNGTSPGPTIEARQGDLVQVTLRNADVADGVTLHWHGIDVPAAEDGVAGVTQDAVRPGGRFVYRFVAKAAGTYWYHSHQQADPQVRGGLWGPVVIRPAGPARADDDHVVAVHTYDGRRTVNGRTADLDVPLAAGRTARLRVIDTDDGPLRAWTGDPSARLVAVDGHDVEAPGPIGARYVDVPAGGRADIAVTVPADGRAVRLDVGGIGVRVGPAGARPAAGVAPSRALDLLHYGRPAPLGFDAAHPDRSFEYRIGRRVGFLDGRPGFWWTVNGHTYPDVPMFVVQWGDVVRMTIGNTGLLGADVHPMHLHGHHAVVLSRDGVPATGSPWWIDSLDVAKGETYVIAFVADNPGIWMDHCHNLAHAADGMLAHLAYTGVRTPFEIGGGNRPE